jgi:hypothetical protein
MLRFAIVLCALGLCRAQEPIGPHSAFEPAAARAAATLEASTAASPRDLLTTGEKSGWAETAPYAEAVGLMRHLEARSRWVKAIEFGVTAEGRAMTALIVSKDRAFTPALAARTGKAIVMVQSGIHAGEIEGKDTVLMLARDMAVAKRHAAWLDSAIFLIIPVFNIDGHEDRSPFHRPSQNGPHSTGLRATAQRLNLNRDYIKADTPEMRAWLRLFNSWMPDFLIDNHVTDGADFQYDVTWDMARNQDIATPARSWVRDRFVPELDRRMQAGGHLVAPYGSLQPGAGGRRELFMEVFSPRYSHLYAAAQNRPALLVETHSLKSARTRAWAHYDIMRHAFDIIAAQAEELRRAVRASDREAAASAGNTEASPLYLDGRVSPDGRPAVYHGLKTARVPSEITGSPVTRYLAEPDDFQTVIHDRIETTVSARVPAGYLVPASWTSVADLLRLHGVEMERLSAPVDGEFEAYRFSGVKFASRSNEGRVGVSFDAKLSQERVRLPEGSWWVPMNQRRARLVAAMLEPAAPDSLAHWGLMNTVFEGAGAEFGEYLAEPVARRMMAGSPELRREFEQKLAGDPAFAADRQARLRWWLERSSYRINDAGLYPIVRVWRRTW